MSTVIDRQVGASADDCRVRYNYGTIELIVASMNVGRWDADSRTYSTGLRFTGITIDSGATITAAYLTLTASVERTNIGIKTRIKGEDAPSPNTFSTFADWDERPRTTAVVDWDDIEAWYLDTEYNSPSIVSIIQELVDKHTYSNGVMVLFWGDEDDRTIADYVLRTAWSYDGSTTKAPKLHIEYTVGEAPPEPVPPLASFVVDEYTGPAPHTVRFIDQSVGEITSWLWDFGDGANSTLQNPSHTYSVAGSYTVSLTVAGPGGLDTETRDGYILVYEVPYEVPIAAFSASPASGVAPLEVQFIDQSVGEITSWIWDFGDGTTSTEVNPTHVYIDPGIYYAELIVTGPDGTSSAALDIVVTAVPAPAPSIMKPILLVTGAITLVGLVIAASKRPRR